MWLMKSWNWHFFFAMSQNLPIFAKSKRRGILMQHTDWRMERWQSGRMRRSWKPLTCEGPGVRIPLFPLKFPRHREIFEIGTLQRECCSVPFFTAIATNEIWLVLRTSPSIPFPGKNCGWASAIWGESFEGLQQVATPQHPPIPSFLQHSRNPPNPVLTFVRKEEVPFPRGLLGWQWPHWGGRRQV